MQLITLSTCNTNYVHLYVFEETIAIEIKNVCWAEK